MGRTKGNEMIRLWLLTAIILMGLGIDAPSLAQNAIYNNSSSKVGGRLSTKGYGNSTKSYGAKGPLYIKGMLHNTSPKTAESTNKNSYKPFNFSDITGTQQETDSAERLEGQIQSYKEERKKSKEDRAKRRTKLLEKYKSKGSIGSQNNSQKRTSSNQSQNSSVNYSSRGSSLSRNSNIISTAPTSNKVTSQKRVNPAYSSSRRTNTTPAKVFTSY